MKFKRIVVLLALLAFSVSGFGQTEEISGYPFVTHFPPSEYGAMPENWAIAQSDEGVMYFGNIAGVLEYDGVNWRMIPVSNKSNVRSLAKDENGRIWVGAVNDIGYLDHDGTGQTIFVSLMGLLAEDDRILDDVWNTHVHQGLVFYQSYQRLLRYDPQTKQFHVWQPQDGARFFPTRIVHDRLLLNEYNGRGLMEVVGDDFITMPGGDFFASENPRVVLPLDHGRIFIATRGQGFFTLDEQGLTPLPTEHDELHKSTGLYKGVTVSGNRFAIGGFSGGGVQIIDHQGQLLQQIDRASGLRALSHLFWDGEGLLWVARIDGISRIELDSPFEIFDERSGVVGRVRKVYDHNGTIYAVGDPNVWVKGPGLETFVPHPGMEPFQYWDVVEFQDTLLIAGRNVYQVKGDQVEIAIQGGPFYVSRLYQSKQNPNLLYLGLSGGSPGLGVAQYQNGEWSYIGQVPGIEVWGYDISETTPGTVWVGTDATGAYRVVMPPIDENLDLSKAVVTHFGPEQGLPLGQVTTPEIDGETLFTVAGDHVYRFDDVNERFIRDTRFDAASYGRPWEWSRMKQDSEGRVWMIVGGGAAMALPVGNGDYKVEKGPLTRFKNDMFYDVAIGKDGYVWLYGENGLVRVDPDWQSGEVKQARTIIRNISAGDAQGLSGGAPGFEFPATTFNYDDNSIRFDFALTSFREEQQNEFQTFLDGYDEDWTDWRPVTWKEYEKVREGEYTFLVRGRDLNGEHGSTASFTFRIKPPFYRSMTAYVLYLLIVLLLLETGRRLVQHRAVAKANRAFELREATSKAERLELQSALLESENERMENELNIGHRIQMGMLTTEFPELEHFEVNAALKPAREVGGDLYDVFFLDNDHLCCFVGDVSGKGVPAALFMAISKTLVKAISTHQLTDYSGRSGADADTSDLHWSTASIMNSVNNELSRDNDENMFVTAFIAILNIRSGRIVYTNAGHNPPYIKPVHGGLQIIDARHGPILGALEGIEYAEGELVLNPDDLLLIYTDGVTEAFSEAGELFTEARLENLLTELHKPNVNDMVTAIFKNVKDFEGSSEQTDDITVLALQRK